MSASSPLSLAISDIYAQTLRTRRITRSHRQMLMDAMRSNALGEEERSAIDRLLWSTTRGRVELVND
ncbi:MAG: hypothetical protein O3C67_01500 [Cyanobacteria bacterium]|nr:hypothetical protein [Cyanobacteriota bacterium]MEB3267529.1 hypothetical protein [Leptolyngbya sp.]